MQMETSIFAKKKSFFCLSAKLFLFAHFFYCCPLVYYFFVLADIKVSLDLCHYAVFTPYTRELLKGLLKLSPFFELFQILEF